MGGRGADQLCARRRKTGGDRRCKAARRHCTAPVNVNHLKNSNGTYVNPTRSALLPRQCARGMLAPLTRTHQKVSPLGAHLHTRLMHVEEKSAFRAADLVSEDSA